MAELRRCTTRAGPRCPHVRCRMLRSRCLPEKRQRETVRVAIARARCCVERKLALRTTKTKRPRSGIRGRSRSSEIGVTDLPGENQSWMRKSFPSCSRASHNRCAHEATSRRWRADSDGLVMRMAGFMAEIVGFKKRNRCGGLRWARTLHPSFGDCKHFFRASLRDGSALVSNLRSTQCIRCSTREAIRQKKGDREVALRKMRCRSSETIPRWDQGAEAASIVRQTEAIFTASVLCRRHGSRRCSDRHWLC
jgi:hypothetical protein